MKHDLSEVNLVVPLPDPRQHKPHNGRVYVQVVVDATSFQAIDGELRMLDTNDAVVARLPLRVLDEYSIIRK